MATEIDIAVTTTTYDVTITATPNEYIVNITTNAGEGVESVTGTTVNNTDPLNPVVNVPTITQVLTQGDISIFIQPLAEDEVFTIPLAWQVSQSYVYGLTTIGTGGVFLDKTVLFSENATLRFCWGYQAEALDTLTPESFEFTTDANVYYNGSPITSLTIAPTDLVMVKSGGVISGENIWILMCWVCLVGVFTTEFSGAVTAVSYITITFGGGADWHALYSNYVPTTVAQNSASATALIGSWISNKTATSFRLNFASSVTATLDYLVTITP